METFRGVVPAVRPVAIGGRCCLSAAFDNVECRSQYFVPMSGTVMDQFFWSYQHVRRSFTVRPSWHAWMTICPAYLQGSTMLSPQFATLPPSSGAETVYKRFFVCRPAPQQSKLRTLVFSVHS